jgi:3-oxoacyl-[acyl-carrier protein] reductase
MNIQDQVVLITGAGRGLGAECAKAFAAQGARVIINYYQSQEKAEALAREIGEQAVALQADVRKKEELARLVQEGEHHFGAPVSTAVHNALVDFRFDPEAQRDLEHVSWESFETQMEGSVKGALNVVQAVLPSMKKQEFGRLIMIGTNLVQNPVVPYHEYTSGKAALLGFTRNAAKELGPSGVTVNMVSGGLLEETDASSVTTPEVFDIIRQTTPLQRVTTPEEMADAVLFFSSPWSRAVTGQNLIVDGGLVMN